jgi:hypothetical protein
VLALTRPVRFPKIFRSKRLANTDFEFTVGFNPAPW